MILIYLFYFFHIASSYSSAEAHLDEWLGEEPAYRSQTYANEKKSKPVRELRQCISCSQGETRILKKKKKKQDSDKIVFVKQKLEGQSTVLFFPLHF